MGNSERGFEGKKVYVHPMTYTGARAVAAALSAFGFDAEVIPPSDEKTLELGSMYASGDECYPLKITLGDVLKLFMVEGRKPENTAIFMPSSSGPCRFGQYVPLIQKILKEVGLGQVTFMSPTCDDGYGSFHGIFDEVKRCAWIGIVASDILRKLTLRYRPYELNAGDTDRAYERSLDEICDLLAAWGKTHTLCLREVKKGLIGVRERFRSLPRCEEERPLIGVVGEIFCRLNRFSNTDILRLVESMGGETWQSDVGEWVSYTDVENERILARRGRRFSWDMFIARMKYSYQKKVEHQMYSIFEEDFKEREEPGDVTEILSLAQPYLPQEGALGEMTLSVGKTAYYSRKGASGVIDLSPFSCMNGIISEAVYYRLSADLGGFPVKIFYFDETHRDISLELEIFMDMAGKYSNGKRRISQKG